MNGKFPGGANNLSSVRLSQMREAVKIATTDELRAFLQDVPNDPINILYRIDVIEELESRENSL